MVNFTLIPALLCAFSWISVSVSELHTVEVQPGEEVTLQCSNFTSFPANIFWFKLVSGTNISRISSMFNSDQNASFYDGFQNSKFNMTSNTTTLFLNIKPVDLSDSGLYFCGFYQGNNSVITVSITATDLRVREVPSDGLTNVTTVILGGITVFLLMVIICLVVKIRTLHTGQHEEVVANPQYTENDDSLNYAALSFRPKAKSTRRPAPERELEQHVVYAATR